MPCHALEYYVTKEQREQHPDWRAIIDGKPHAVAAEVEPSRRAASRCRCHHRDSSTSSIVHTVSLSPDDGNDFDESDDSAWDAGDYDPAWTRSRITDRYVKFCNIVADESYEEVSRCEVRLSGLCAVHPPAGAREAASEPGAADRADHLLPRPCHDRHTCPRASRSARSSKAGARPRRNVSYYNYMFHLAESRCRIR